MRRLFTIIICVLSMALAIGPATALFLSTGLPPWIHAVSALNFIAWTALCVVFIVHKRLNAAVDEAFTAIGLPPVQGDLDERISAFLHESERYHRAAYAFRSDTNVTDSDLGLNLRRIVTLAYQELRAQSAELALYDEGSGMWSQSLVVGAPRSHLSQSMLVDASTQHIAEDGGTKVLVQPLKFAGSMFGALRVELQQGIEPGPSDLQVAHLLATQGALMLVDARFTEELLKMRRTSEESLRAKTGFLANLSHEIRGPLGIILNGAELIMDGLCGPVTEAQKQTVTMVKTSGDHLLDLVNDVLDYAKVEAGKVVAKPLTLALKPLLTDITNVVRGQAQLKGHKVVLEPVEESMAIVCDKRHARQMLINFLTNAIKYTPDGGEIKVWAERVAGNRIKISIKDSGVGIPAEQRSKVFGAFERVDDSYSNSQGGTGLGMPLTKKLAEVNDGVVDFESEQGKGSTFWLVIPAGELAERNAADGAADGDAKVLQGQGEAILLVDSDTDARDMLERYLVHQGFAILNATSGAEVMKVLREREIELAVVESDLPDASGEELISVIRSNPRAASVPIILLSSKAFVFDVERFLKLGVDRCLAKPVELSELAHTARRLIDETKSLAQ